MQSQPPLLKKKATPQVSTSYISQFTSSLSSSEITSAPITEASTHSHDMVGSMVRPRPALQHAGTAHSIPIAQGARVYIV
mmetsp:Transcript_9227/g.15054  ORF Transcript_9227/g.15054 Transcript_9227/m.15054 type:complete len:80 (+) Transcript_9227:45-284(+)